MSVTARRQLITATVAAIDLGQPSARKSGRNPRWPYVPIVKHGHTTQQILGIAYATREEAVATAARNIEALRASIARKLDDRCYRALRQRYGLPAELADLDQYAEDLAVLATIDPTLAELAELADLATFTTETST